MTKQIAQEICDLHGWKEIFFHDGQYWAFPPGAVMPLPIPIAQSRKTILKGAAIYCGSP